MSSATVDVRDVQVVFRSPTWQPLKTNIAVASGVTDDGRTVQGIGTNTWSAEKAQDQATESIRQAAQKTDFEFHINTISGGRTNQRIEILWNRGEINVKDGGFTGSPTVEVTAWRGEHSTDSRGKKRVGLPIISNPWQSCLNSALDSVDNEFDRLGMSG